MRFITIKVPNIWKQYKETIDAFWMEQSKKQLKQSYEKEQPARGQRYEEIEVENTRQQQEAKRKKEERERYSHSQYWMFGH